LSEYKNWLKEEDVHVTLFIPNGVTVHFDNSTKDYINRANNTTGTYRRDMAKHYFTMTDDGLHSKELKALEEEDQFDDIE